MLTPAERQASLEASMRHWHPDTDVWVFGYGSLIWRPDFDFAERREARLHGYHRSLCLWSRVNRGTPEKPGLVFGLDRGGSCKGVAFRIRAADVPATMQTLWYREMPTGAYIPRWLTCRTPEGAVRALVFTMNRAIETYVPNLPPERLVTVINQAHGRSGACREYVMETASALQQHNIHDRRLESIMQHLHTAAAPVVTPPQQV
ncbi:MAG TPA: gamma-glutamylcyclotransferase [Burkholderiaceae bacterium]|nr:gamma-glutamylcyclotransferase [Burkholderiaceae bacterium]